MLSIMFAKTNCSNPKELVGQSIDTHTRIKAIKTYAKVEHTNLVAVLIDAPTQVKSVHHSDLHTFATHKVQLRPTPKSENVNETVSIRQYSKRQRQREKMTTLSEKSWSLFVKRKHILNAYHQTTASELSNQN